MIRLLILLLALLAPALATADVLPTAANNVRVELIAESAAPAPGKAVTLAIVLTPKPGWHTYWSNPGEAGFAPKATWTGLGEKGGAGPLRFPVPVTLLVSGLMNYVYKAPATLLVDVTGAAGPVGVKLNYLVCTTEICVPETAEASVALHPGDGTPDPTTAARFAAARAALPVPLAGAHYAVANGRIAFGVPVADPAGATGAYFFPAADGAVDYATPQVVNVAGKLLRIETKADPKAHGSIDGVLRIERDGKAEGFALTATPGAVPAAGAAAGRRDGTGSVFATALLLAIAGGVILNIMPCVFPILSLKALSLAKGGASPADARRDALAYAAGVIAVCTGLGALILGLRAAGTQVGWAFQLQDPRVIAGLLLLVTAIALNLAGLFELGNFGGGQNLASKPGAAGSFWTGALAAFVATPCTGPFMAGALGAALVLPPAAGLLVFAGLGLGLALPFMAIGFIPALRRRLPRPGAWMATFRSILSVPMFLTALALAWVLGRQAGVGGMTLGVGGAVLIGLALWWFGSRQRAYVSGWPALLAAGIAAVAAVALVVPETSTATTVDAPAGLAAAKFSEPALAALTAAHTPAFVYFTADWCLTCKVNERGAIASSDVAAAFRRGGVKTLVGDWTNGDPALGRFIEAHNRAGVPLYLFYHRDGRVEVLPQVLTVTTLVALTT
ncbi:MAG: protein-disulfide reductase DsbD family protein [Janthinobacterium lividum]